MSNGSNPQCKFCRKKYYVDNQDRLNNQNFYNKENHDQIIEHHKKYSKQNRAKIKIYETNRWKTDINYILACNLRSRTNKDFKCQNV